VVRSVEWLLTVPPAWRWLLTLAFVALVIALSVAPGVARPGDSVFEWLVANTATPVQKAMHVAIYAMLAALWFWTLESVDSRILRFALALVVTVGLGALLEWRQTMVPGRFGTLMDVMLNACGAIAGLIMAGLLL